MHGSYRTKYKLEQARVKCLKDAECIGIDRQNIVRSRTCGNSIVKLCRKFALRGTCDCSNPGCNPSDCNRFKADKVTCIHRKGKRGYMEYYCV